MLVKLTTGITQYGVPCSDPTRPQNSEYMRKPGLYVRLQNFTQWIEETIDNGEDDDN
jgi:hypothetical protein